jgi:hypothetical protein
MSKIGHPAVSPVVGVPDSLQRCDHSDKIPHPGTYPFIIEPIITSKCLSKVLMNRGSNLNIMYVETLDDLGIARPTLRPISASFHTIILGHQSYPLG